MTIHTQKQSLGFNSHLINAFIYQFSKCGLVLPAHSIMLETGRDRKRQSRQHAALDFKEFPASKGDRQWTCKQIISNTIRFCPLTVHNRIFEETWFLKSCDMKSKFFFSRNRNRKPCGIESGGITKFPLCYLSPTFDSVLPASCPAGETKPSPQGWMQTVTRAVTPQKERGQICRTAFGRAACP